MSLDVDSFMEELNEHVMSSGTIIFLSERGSEEWDVRRSDGKLFFGKSKSQNAHFRSILSKTIARSRIVSITLHSLTQDHDPITGYSVMELRGYLLSVENNTLKWYMIDAEDLMESRNADSRSGDHVEQTQSVVYCGPNDRCVDCNGVEILKVTIGHGKNVARKQ
ncbi:MAG: hypothetical protein QW597_06970 [Thermoplasmataceae archaeon]